MFELTGIVKLVKDEQVISEKFKKREFVLTDNSSQYPQDIMLQLTQDHCDKINGVNVGDTITVKFNLRGREWINPQGEAKYFNTLDCWYVQKGSATPQAEPAPNLPESGPEDDGLPF
jgi:hypothetical protein